MASQRLARAGTSRLLEHLLEALDLAAGLFQVLLEGLAQLGRLHRLGHLRQGFHELLLGVIDVAELVDEQVLDRFHSHLMSLPVCNDVSERGLQGLPGRDAR